GEKKKATRVLLCTGKVYYDLVRKRDDLHCDDVVVLRIEQLYPFPAEPLRRAMEQYPDGSSAYWVQEEPENMGAWRYLRVRLGESFSARRPLGAFPGPPSAGPAGGSGASHKLEQERLLDEAFGK